MPSNTSWRTTAIACALLGCALSVGARLVVGPPGAYVHVEWQPTVDEATREQVTERYHLDKPEKLKDPFSWRYDLVDPSSDNIRALVADPAVKDTYEIDRHAFTLEPTAPRTARRSRMAQGDEVVRTADGLAIELLVFAVVALLARTAITRLLARGIPELDAAAAGLFRIVFGTAVVAFFAYQRVNASWLAATFDVEIEGWLHATVLDFLRGHPAVVDLLTPWLLLTGVAFTAGLFTRWTYPLFVAGALVRAFVAVSIDSTHPQSVLVLTLVALLPSRWGDAFSLDAWRRRARGGGLTIPPASRHYGYSVWVPGLIIGVAWAAAAWAKLSVPPHWNDWVLNGTVKYHFVTDSVNAPLQWGLQFARHPLLAILASFGVIALEAAVITAAFARNDWYRLALGGGVVALFSGFYLFMGVFWPAWWITMLGFLPWQRIWRALQPANRAIATPAGPTSGPRSHGWGGLIPTAQSFAIVAILTQQVVASAMKLDQAPMFSWYDMYSATYTSPADWAASRPPRYHIIASTAQGSSELPRCNPHSEFVREFEAALKGSADARSSVWQELRGCGKDLAGVREVSLTGDVQTFDWERLVFTVSPSAVTLGPLPAEPQR